jgi:hypothetical protein
VQLMPNIQVRCAKRCQGRVSFWHVAQPIGIVRKIF